VSARGPDVTPAGGPAPGDAAFPPPDGWCVEITRGDEVVERSVFLLAEDAREHAKGHAWRHKGDVARVFERRAGDTVFSTVIRFDA
jgi:hypothetical protein